MRKPKETDGQPCTSEWKKHTGNCVQGRAGLNRRIRRRQKLSLRRRLAEL